MAVATDGMVTAGGVSPHPIIGGLLLDIVQKSRGVRKRKDIGFCHGTPFFFVYEVF